LPKPPKGSSISLQDEHLDVEDYPSDQLNIMEGYYVDNPTAFSKSKILESKNLTRMNEKQKEHLIEHLEEIISGKIIEKEGAYRGVRNPELAFAPPPSDTVARVVITRRNRRYVFYRDVITQQFVSPYPKKPEKAEVKDEREDK
jgi:hypothetical protein